MSIEKAIAKHKELQAAAKRISIEDVQNAWTDGAVVNDVNQNDRSITLTKEIDGYMFITLITENCFGTFKWDGNKTIVVLQMVSNIKGIILAHEYLLQELGK